VDHMSSGGLTNRAGRWGLAALVAIVFLATVLRIGWPRLTEFKFSEARLVALALELTREGRVPLVGVPSSAGFDHSPISVYLYVPAFLLTANPILATIYGGLVGVAAVALAWRFGRRWPGGGVLAAAVAALLLTASPWAVAFSRKIWQVAFVPLLSLGFVGLSISALVPTEAQRTQPSQPANRARSEQPKRISWMLVAALIVLAVLIQVHPSAIALVPALALWLVVFRRRVQLASLVVGAGLAALTGIPFLLHQLQSGWPVLAALGDLQAARWDTSAWTLTWEAITGRGVYVLAGESQSALGALRQVTTGFNLVGGLAIGMGTLLVWRVLRQWQSAEAGLAQEARVDLVLISWLVAPVLFNLRYSLPLHLHFFALVLPAAYLVIGRGIQWIADGWRPTSRGRLLSGSLVLLVVLISGTQIAALALLGRFVDSHSTAGGFGTPLGDYLKIATQLADAATEAGAAEALVVAEGDSPVVDEIPAVYSVLLTDRIPHRFVDGRTAAVFPSAPAVALLVPPAGPAAEWYDSWPMRDLGDGHELVFLDGTWPTAGLWPVSGPRLFETGIEIQSYDWWSEQAASAAVGRLWLQWQVLWLSPEDTHFSVRVLEETGQLWGQADATGYPTAYRRKGDRVMSQFDIMSTDSGGGPVQAQASLYYYPQVISVPVVNEAGQPVDDRVVLGPVELEQ
jgi:hypothetical protein